jgi:hypothetical protein
MRQSCKNIFGVTEFADLVCFSVLNHENNFQMVPQNKGDRLWNILINGDKSAVTTLPVLHLHYATNILTAEDGFLCTRGAIK